MQQYREAAKAVQEHMHDENWLQAAAAHFRQICIETETDKERSVRIANEVRAEKWATDAEDMMPPRRKVPDDFARQIDGFRATGRADRAPKPACRA